MDENQKRLRQLMAIHGLKSRDVADILHKADVTVRQYRTGKIKMKDELIFALEHALKERI